MSGHEIKQLFTFTKEVRTLGKQFVKFIYQEVCRLYIQTEVTLRGRQRGHFVVPYITVSAILEISPNQVAQVR